MKREWTWADATPTERANAVRNHGRMAISFCYLCRMFNLTANGAWEILKGDDWRPEYDMDIEKQKRRNLIREVLNQ